MRVLTVEAMREVDRAAVEDLGIPSVVLMENAALGVADAIGRELPGAETAAVFCGPGNNGGDGLAVARHLAVRGLSVFVGLATEGRDYRGDAAIQFHVASQMANSGITIVSIEGDALDEIVEHAARCDVIVDALFGTGLSRPLAGPAAELVAAIGNLPESPFIVSVDLPSGLNGNLSDARNLHVQADLTVTFAAPKIAHVFSPASLAAGSVVVTDLGVPPDLVERAPGDLRLLEAEELSALLLNRPENVHKGDFGHVLVVAGSVGKSGAAVLAAKGALRAGAGLVTAAVPPDVLAVFEAASVESMSEAVPVSPTGSLGDESLLAIEKSIGGKDVLALGPGLGTDAETGKVIRTICGRCELPLVLDADGLTAYAGRIGELSSRAAATVLTPHPGELGRLLGVSAGEVSRDRLEAVRRAARESACLVVLKGHLSLIADPEGGVYVNPTGNPGMATAGSGDVLTGIIAGYLAQRYEPLAAAQLGTFLHGLAGDLARDELGEASVVAGDLLEYLPTAMLDLSGEWIE